MMTRIVLGSTSPHKVAAVDDALLRAGFPVEITARAVPSGVNEQPIGGEETTRGAMNRAYGALDFCSAEYAIGIESGLEEVAPDIWVDKAVVVIAKRGSVAPMALAVTTSVGIRFPLPCVLRCRQAGFIDHTVGEFIAAEYGGSATDAVTTLTKGKLSRQGLIADAVYAALVMAGLAVERQ